MCNSQDWDCIQRILRGDSNAYAELVQKHMGIVRKFAIRASTDSDEQDDFIQEVFFQAYQSLSQFRGEAEFSTWLYQIASRNAQKKSLKENSHLNVDDLNLFDRWKLSSLETWKRVRNSANAETQYLREELHARIRELVGRLPQQYRSPIELYYFENLSYKEISERLGLKINTLKSYLFRGKEILKDWYHEKD